MVTKEQAMTDRNFIQVKKLDGEIKSIPGSISRYFQSNGKTIDLEKPIKWRASGKCQTWKTRPEEFKLPIKFGLYESNYLTHENAHLFEVAK
jgi:hypothetical protein